MKYKITGVSPEETIKSYKICKEGIKVKFLKGSKIFPNNDRNLKEVKEIMEEQANKFINDPNLDSMIDNYIKCGRILSKTQILFLVGFLCSLTKIDSSLVLLMLSCTSGLSGLTFDIKLKRLVDSYAKYNLFLQNKEYYSNNIKKIEVNDLDKIKYEELFNFILDNKSLVIEEEEQKKLKLKK